MFKNMNNLGLFISSVFRRKQWVNETVMLTLTDSSENGKWPHPSERLLFTSAAWLLIVCLFWAVEPVELEQRLCAHLHESQVFGYEAAEHVGGQKAGQTPDCNHNAKLLYVWAFSLYHFWDVKMSAVHCSGWQGSTHLICTAFFYSGLSGLWLRSNLCKILYYFYTYNPTWTQMKKGFFINSSYGCAAFSQSLLFIFYDVLALLFFKCSFQKCISVRIRHAFVCCHHSALFEKNKSNFLKYFVFFFVLRTI